MKIKETHKSKSNEECHHQDGQTDDDFGEAKKVEMILFYTNVYLLNLIEC